eukprot:6176311-Pleurochrysis_carterae.AAC.2
MKSTQTQRICSRLHRRIGNLNRRVQRWLSDNADQFEMKGHGTQPASAPRCALSQCMPRCGSGSKGAAKR